jgi:hypothetical protein
VALPVPDKINALAALHIASEATRLAILVRIPSTLLIIVVVIVLLVGGGWYGRGRWF